MKAAAAGAAEERVARGVLAGDVTCRPTAVADGLLPQLPEDGSSVAAWSAALRELPETHPAVI